MEIVQPGRRRGATAPSGGGTGGLPPEPDSHHFGVRRCSLPTGILPHPTPALLGRAVEGEGEPASCRLDARTALRAPCSPSAPPPSRPWSCFGVGSADPPPTVEQVQAQVDALNQEAAVAAERYNDARLRLDDVQARLASAQERAGTQEARVAAARQNLSAFASATYRFGGIDPTVQFFTSSNPEQFLASSASLSQLSNRQAASLRNVISERALLAQDNALATEQFEDLSVAKAKLESLKNDVEEKLGEAKHLLDRLQAADRARVLAAQRGSRDAGSERQPLEYYTGSASGPAAEAIAFAYAQLGDRYVYGAAGPNSWDCSGLTMGAWGRPAFPCRIPRARSTAAGARLPAPSCNRATWCSSTHRSATWASTSATAR